VPSIIDARSLYRLHPCLSTDCHLHLPPCAPSFSPSGCSRCSEFCARFRDDSPVPPPWLSPVPPPWVSIRPACPSVPRSFSKYFSYMFSLYCYPIGSSFCVSADGFYCRSVFSVPDSCIPPWCGVNPPSILSSTKISSVPALLGLRSQQLPHLALQSFVHTKNPFIFSLFTSSRSRCLRCPSSSQRCIPLERRRGPKSRRSIPPTLTGHCFLPRDRSRLKSRR